MTASAGRSSSPPGWTRTTNIAVADLHLDISVIGFVISLATTTELADAAEATNKHLASGDFTRKAASIMPLVTSAAMWRIRAADPRAGLADGWRA